MRVCVVIPTYNRSATLARAVRSVFAQTYKNWELWIVDDGSTDDTEALVAGWLHVCYIKQTNQGVSAARNRAIFATEAPWIAFLDSDDEWRADKLEKQVSLVKTASTFRIVHTDELWLRNGSLVPQQKKHAKIGGRAFASCLPLCFISPSTTLIETNLLRQLGGFREDFPVCEDYDLWLKICATEDVGFIAEPLVTKYGGHADQLSTKLKAMDAYRVQALLDIRHHPALTAEERRALYEELARKLTILESGYAKHARSEDLRRTRDWQKQINHERIQS